MVRIKFLGAAREVTGSMHILKLNDFELLVDCGLIQGKRKESFNRNRDFKLRAGDVDAMILTHAHVDHSGNIPLMVANGYKNKIYSTHATKDLCSLMLPDSAYVQMKDLEYVNKKRAKKGQALFEPLYTLEDAEKSMDYFDSKNLGEHFRITEGMEAYFLNAGHILGSSMAIVKVKDGDRQMKIGFSGDLGRKELPILKDPDEIYDVDYLVMESTYGGREHEPVPTAFDEVAKVITETYEKGGKTIIPVFAVERAQEILYVLNKLFNAEKIPPMPIFVDSPLTINVMEVFKKHSECFDEDMLEHIAENNNPFYLELVKYTKEVEESMQINDYDKPCIILSASGMCEAGRILHHLKNNIEDPNSTVMFVGYQAVNTLGRRIVDGFRDIKIFGDPYVVQARIHVAEAFSGHAGRSALIAFAKKANESGRLKKIFLVHGEEEQQEMLMEDLKKAGIKDVFNPMTEYEEVLE